MKFKYSVIDSSQSELDSLPRLPLSLYCNNQHVEVLGLVDSGATINVLPYEVGVQLGETWNNQKANIPLAGNLGNLHAIPLAVTAKIDDFEPVRLVFAWVKSNDVPLILGQTNFFMEFEICFYRSRLEFEIRPR
ncbi:MAG: hypothetical protein B6242_04455 [Anaerolineaceae bacterium 4572_78]|nr:MAG: hypothetical protein B6242_04455 [Anaerolineaceae bacterium 4572_78]